MQGMIAKHRYKFCPVGVLLHPRECVLAVGVHKAECIVVFSAYILEILHLRQGWGECKNGFLFSNTNTNTSYLYEYEYTKILLIRIQI